MSERALLEDHDSPRDEPWWLLRPNTLWTTVFTPGSIDAQKGPRPEHDQTEPLIPTTSQARWHLCGAACDSPGLSDSIQTKKSARRAGTRWHRHGLGSGGIRPRHGYCFNLKTAVGRPSMCIPSGVCQGLTRRNSQPIPTSCNAARRRAECALEVVAAFTELVNTD